MKPARTRLMLAAALAGTLTLAWLAPGEEGDSPSTVAAKPRRGIAASHDAPVRPVRAPQAPAAAPERLMPAQRPSPPLEVPDLFRSFSWHVPAPPPPAPPPPAPTAPPLPFAFIGQYAEEDRQLILLTRGDRLLTVAVGDVIDRTYRVETMAGGRLIFVYLPLDLRQTLDTGVIQ